MDRPAPSQGVPVLPDTPLPGEQKDLLFAVAEFLYGQRWGWKQEFAMRVRVEPRTVRRWLSGQDSINPTAWELIRLLVRFKEQTGRLV